jgi:hypothetical protein
MPLATVRRTYEMNLPQNALMRLVLNVFANCWNVELPITVKGSGECEAPDFAATRLRTTTLLL